MRIVHASQPLDGDLVIAATRSGGVLRRAARAARAAFGVWRRSARERRDLLAVDARTRRDLCLTHADVMRHVDAPVWPLVSAAARAAWRHP